MVTFIKHDYEWSFSFPLPYVMLIKYIKKWIYEIKILDWETKINFLYI